MCYRTKLNSKIKEIEKTFSAGFIDPESYSPQEEINGFNFSPTPVITDENPGEIDLFHWGLIPFWAKDDSIRKMTLNAKIETVEEKPAFRNSVNNRCLIIADGYYEWQWLDSKGKSKQKHLLEVQDQEIFAFAGIYSSWRNPNTDQLINSYSILTTEANELMSKIHNNKKRMPVVLNKPDREKWISGAQISQFSFPYEVQLKASKI
ncbi:Putative SOS response-associated peptidase YedK [Salinimicrobium catena]|uniref:Abasic site processing protein n=1 Tax=Salinimicrobium catena TaxID=390640 RepID=A0A1H5P546_9FLAO|nr:SOS response-associated peptidase [Salinimicrobium catena]SDL72078.1 Putative SOS response-associated peptidase YedK [Salinimicrobium catena]SEF09006.1 Putative SOS response-associated peptidase YedK [Salinimicrobium catena]